MPQIRMPNGDMVQFPDDMPADQIKGMIEKKFPDAGNTRGGDLARGLLHGAASSFNAGGAVEGLTGPDKGGGWRETGEQIGGVIPPTVAGVLAPESLIGKGLFGAGTGALQPAKDWKERAENTGIGALSAFGGGALAKSPRMKTVLDHLAEMGIGAATGSHYYGVGGGLGGSVAGLMLGPRLERMFGGGLGDLVGWLAKNPGLAASMGVKLRPAANEAGEYVGQELGKPSQ